VVYHLRATDFAISLVKISENVFHLLTEQGEFMNGNSGWSYSLSRDKMIEPNKILIKSSDKEDRSVQQFADRKTKV